MKLSSQAPLEDLSTFSLDSTAGGTSGQIKAAGFNIATANISFNLVNPTLDDAVYVTATYTGSLVGAFSTSAPTGYSWNYGTGTNKPDHPRPERGWLCFMETPFDRQKTKEWRNVFAVRMRCQ